MSRDRQTRRLVVCKVCRHDKANVYRDEAGTVTVVCSSCGHEMLRSQEAAATA